MGGDEVDGDDTVARVPLHPEGKLTYDEWHAILLGAAAGVIAGIGLLFGLEQPVFWISVGMLVTTGLIGRDAIELVCRRCVGDVPSTGDGEGENTAERTIRKKPWYFLVSYLIAAGAVYGVGSWPWL